MLGIEEIASYIPQKRISNYSRKKQFSIDDNFIEEKIGVRGIAVKDDNEDTSDLCVKAYYNLARKTIIDKTHIEALIVVTQNPDTNIPHSSAIVHGKLDLPEKCACFDVSLGSSGFVCGLNILQAFMEKNSFTKGLLFTSDPYSKIIDKNDKNTALLFGDAATVTLISDKPLYILENIISGTRGKDYKELMCVRNKLYMNGRAVYNFTVKNIPDNIRLFMKENGLQTQDIDRFVFHQGSKHIVDTLTKKLMLDSRKVVYDIYEYGNTVSSSIPLILEKEMKNSSNRKILICGFGVGLSWSIGILKRV